MWPLYVSQLIDIVGARCSDADANDDDDDAIAKQVLYRAIAWRGPKLDARDSFFAVEPSLLDDVPAALDAGAVCIVQEGWPGLANLRSESRTRCFVVADHPLMAYRRLASFMRERFYFPVIAVGGSNGKTTTKDMIAHVIQGLVTATPGTNNGWVGVPITLCQPYHAARAPDRPAVIACVLEIGIDAKGVMQQHVAIARPDVALLTALGPEHLAGLGTHEDAIREELALFAGSKRRVWLPADPAIAARLEDARADDLIVVDESTDEPNAKPATEIARLGYRWQRLSPTEGSLSITWKGQKREARIPLPGEHNGRNAALAIGAALMIGRPLDETLAALATFGGPKQRCVVSELPSGCILIDDSYNASPSSIDAALDVLAGFDPRRPRLVILGDMLDLGDEAAKWHQTLIPRLASLRSAHVRLYGEQMSALASSLVDAASVACASASDDPITLIDVADLDECVVLVKGSRGMALERAVAYITTTESAHSWNERDAIGVGIVGEGAEDLARLVRTAIRHSSERTESESESNSKSTRRVFVRALDQTALEGGEPIRHPYHVAFLTKLALDPNNNPEHQLAAIAQLFMHVKAIAILPSQRAARADVDADVDDAEEALQLLASVVPPSAHCRRRHERDDESRDHSSDHLAILHAISTLKQTLPTR